GPAGDLDRLAVGSHADRLGDGPAREGRAIVAGIVAERGHAPIGERRAGGCKRCRDDEGQRESSIEIHVRVSPWLAPEVPLLAYGTTTLRQSITLNVMSPSWLNEPLLSKAPFPANVASPLHSTVKLFNPFASPWLKRPMRVCVPAAFRMAVPSTGATCVPKSDMPVRGIAPPGRSGATFLKTQILSKLSYRQMSLARSARSRRTNGTSTAR